LAILSVAPAHSGRRFPPLPARLHVQSRALVDPRGAFGAVTCKLGFRRTLALRADTLADGRFGTGRYSDLSPVGAETLKGSLAGTPDPFSLWSHDPSGSIASQLSPIENLRAQTF
jgi:hypothetical protein